MKRCSRFFSERVLTAAVVLAVDAVLLAELFGAELPAAFFEFRGQPRDAELLREGFAQGVDADGRAAASVSKKATAVVTTTGAFHCVAYFLDASSSKSAR